MASSFGNHIRYSFFGEANADFIGIVIDGLPSGEFINTYDIKEFLHRREVNTTRGFSSSFGGSTNKDEFQILSGLVDDTTCGTPLCAVIANGKISPSEKDPDLLQPGEADLVSFFKHGTAALSAESSHLTERLMTALCFGGAIARALLEKRGITVGAHILSLGRVQDKPFDPTEVTADELKDPGRYPFPTFHFGVGDTMKAQIESVEKKGDTLGGIIEIGVLGLPEGLGEPFFDSMEGTLAKNLFAIPSVRGVEFGCGFRSASMQGSQYNDEICLKENKIKTKTNNTGGALYGITTGMPMVIRAALRPSPIFPCEQDTVNVKSMTEAVIETKDHIPCLVPQTVPVCEAIATMTRLDLLIK